MPTYSKVVGRHSLKFGVNYSRRHFSTNTTNPMDGSVNFDPSLTNLPPIPNSGDSFASMLLGLPSAVRRGTGNTVTEPTSTVHQYYAQDDWRVTDKLTVNLGLRYEAIPAPVEDTEPARESRHQPRSVRPASISGTLLWATTNPEVDPATGVAGEPANTGGYGPLSDAQ